tara:strand:+ start:16919 stop:18439 length:1521 start_codon:yes stop_codon:yes gene_type:complete
MAQRFYKIDLRDSLFPMLSEQQTRTTIGASDGESPAKEDKPGVAYCHNVMPSAYGFDSVGYISKVPASAFLDAGESFIDVRVIFGSARSRIHLAWDSEGTVYALFGIATLWIPLSSTIPATGGAGFSAETVTVGTVNGVSYIWYSGIGAFTYNEVTNQLDNVVLTGLITADILGVVASSGYLIAYTDSAIAWSSTLVPTDFVPSSVTGAGGGNVAGIAGDILFCTANTLGILVYTAANTIAGTYTGNTQFPFKFREVDNSKGGIALDRVAYEANSSEQYVFSKAGLQAMSSRAAAHILPDVTDFLAGRRFEDYNETTKQYEITDLAPTATMLKKIKYVASRYLVISYGITSFTHALVLDTALSKLGKLRITHTDCFEYVSDQTEIAKESLAFLLASGEVQLVDFSTGAASSGVLILGKVQYVSSRMITLLGVELENVETGSSLTVEDQAALDGKNFTNVASTLTAASAGDLRKYVFRNTAKNHSLVFTGKFNLVTAQVRYTVAGRR